ncbi:MAG: DUF3887 domain-containing protein [Deltaproteobacteria bacterium]|nr:DUF3887 domain-containing protein [Deltaproteobacteria bacterium]
MVCRKAAFFLVLFCLAATLASADIIGTADQQVQAVADPILDDLLAGFNEGDYQKYSKDFDQTLKESLPEARFKQVRGEILQKLGKYQSRKYLGFLNQNKFTVVLWKGKFSNSTSDVLIKLVTSKRPDKVVVVGLWFQ